MIPPSSTITQPEESNKVNISKPGKPQRLLSLDVFRGITVAAMILVNNPGDWSNVYAPLLHAKWHGVTPTDLIFPFFLFIVGVSISFSLSGKKLEKETHADTIQKIIKRSLILFGLGLFLNLFPGFNFSTVRIPGVLQRIAVVFCICGILFLKTSTRTQVYTFAFLLISYWLMMTFIPVPGVGFANLEPETNLGAWLDNTLLHGHLWKTSKVWDPEGLLSTLPAIGTGLSGILAGQWLRTVQETDKKIVWLFVAANFCLVAGLLWSLIFPLNKALWTSSFVLYTSGLALHFLAMCYWLIDVKGYISWTKPFLVFGVNAITVFFLSGLIPRILNMIKVNGANGEEQNLRTYLYETFFTPYFSPINASLAGAATFVLIWLAILWIMYNKRIIIKV